MKIIDLIGNTVIRQLPAFDRSDKTSLRQKVQRYLNIGLKALSAQLIPIVKKSQPLLINGMNKSVAQKFFWFWSFLETKNLKGNIAELGVGKGSGLA